MLDGTMVGKQRGGRCFQSPGGFSMTVRDEVETLGREFSKAATNQDVEELVGFYAKDARILPPNAPMVQGPEGFRSMFKEYIAAGMKTLDLETVDVVESGDLAVEVGQYIMTIDAPGVGLIEDRGKYVGVFRRQANGELKLIIDTFNSDAPAPTA